MTQGWPIRPALVRRAALLGAATGGRSTIGLTALALTAPDGWLARRPVRLTFVAATAIELLVDKLPITPSRLERRGLVGRLVAGAAAGGLLAARADERSVVTVPLAAGIGAVASIGAAFAGTGWRRSAAHRWGRDLPGAVAEDFTSATLAAVAVVR